MVTVTSIGFPLFVAVLGLFWFRLPAQRRWLAMAVASGLFYLLLDAKGFPVLLLCTAVVWQCALRLEKGKGWLILGLAGALAPLLLLKYGGMVTASLAGLWQPLGISYFSLQLTGYLLDVKRGCFTAEKRFLRLFCYAGFFLSITQGPFNRYNMLMPQLEQPIKFDGARLWHGAQRMAWGYFKKYAVADRAAVAVNSAFADPSRYDRSQLIFAAILFAFQLYADFSGYTDIVLGAGECLGLRLPENFRQPFLAASVQEFWSRWHISLSQWFRDYVYIPLGGSRCSPVRRDGNLILTFLVSGLWHGASWTFVVWGCLQGLIQSIENHLPWRKAFMKGKARVLGIVGTFTVFIMTLTIFRADSFATAALYFKGILFNSGCRVFSEYWLLGIGSRLEVVQLLLGVVLLIAVDVLHERKIHLRDWVAARSAPVRLLVYEASFLLFLFMGYFLGGGGFLYARF